MEFHFDCSHRELQSALHAIVSSLAAERGLAVKETRLTLSAVSSRALEFKVECDVKAMIVSTTLVVLGCAEIDDDLRATVTDLSIEEGGMLASLASAAIEPQLAKFRGRSFQVADLKIPGLRVCDVRLTAGERVRFTVQLATTA
ncbi:MAG: hypothetical protein ABMA13_02060 [Chthoniobacteraceae bacterium]